MRRYFINFKNSARDRASQISAKAYNHYLRFQPYLGKIYAPIKQIHQKFYGSRQKGTNLPR